MHWPEKALQYKGMLPFGSEVIKYVNNHSFGRKVAKSPDYADHVFLQEITNKRSIFSGKLSIEINNEMYLQGREI